MPDVRVVVDVTEGQVGGGGMAKVEVQVVLMRVADGAGDLMAEATHTAIRTAGSGPFRLSHPPQYARNSAFEKTIPNALK